MVVALIGAVGVVAVALIGLASAHAQQRSLREKLRKDSETLGALRPGSYAHQQLSTWIDEMTYRLVMLELASERNRYVRTLFLRCASLWIATVLIILLLEFWIDTPSTPQFTKTLYTVSGIGYVVLSFLAFVLFAGYFAFSRRVVWKPHRVLRDDSPPLPGPPPRDAPEAGSHAVED